MKQPVVVNYSVKPNPNDVAALATVCGLAERRSAAWGRAFPVSDGRSGMDASVAKSSGSGAQRHGSAAKRRGVRYLQCKLHCDRFRNLSAILPVAF